MTFFKFFGGRVCQYHAKRLPSAATDHLFFADIIYYLQGMIEIIFMPLSINIFSACQVNHLRKNNLQQTALIKQIKTNRRPGAHQYFIQFIGNALLRYNFNTLYILL